MRYMRLYIYFLQFSFSKAFNFRVDFFFRIFMDIIFYTIQFLFFKVLYLHTNTLAGWNIEQMSLFIAAYIFVDALNMTIFSTNCWWLPIYINRGDLDYYLTKPVSTLFFLSFKEFAANSFVNLLIATGLLVTMLTQYSVELSAWKIFIFIILLINGAAIYYLTHLLFLLSVFWTGSPRGFGDLFFSAAPIVERPDKIFKGSIRFVFLYIMPFSLMASYPARYLMEENANSIIITIICITTALFSVVQIVWRRGLRVYSSASS